jgi:hypothetical protein
MGKLGRLGLEPAQRYERQRPGELIHIDVKKLGRIGGGAGHRVTGYKGRKQNPRKRDAAGVDRYTLGWEYVHIAIDDCTRLAYAEVLSDEKGSTAVGFLRRAIGFYQRHGIGVQSVMTDNGRPLHLSAARDRLSAPARQASPHSSLPPTDQRQGRAVHPHAPWRMGLRRDLPQQRRAHGRP